jgi:branched-chain amino acid transport system permease protein
MRALFAKLTVGYIIAIAIIVLLAILPVIDAPESWILYALLFFVYLAMSNMWNLVAGYSGLISLAQPAFIGLGGYALAMGTWADVPWWAGLIGGAVVAGIFAFLISFAVFRLSGVYFAIGTLVVPEALRIVFYVWKPVGGGLSGGGAGYTIKNIASVGMNEIYWMALVTALVTLIVMRIILRSNLGLALAAIRDNQRAAASFGINTFRIKMYPFVIGAVITGLAGGVFYIHQGYIEPLSTFNVKWTMIIFLATVIGGLRTEGGPVIGTLIFVFLYLSLSRYAVHSLLIQGVILIVIMLLSPQGIMGMISKTAFHRFVLQVANKQLIITKADLKNDGAIY